MKNNLLLGTNNAGKLKEFIFYIKHFNLFNEYEVLNLNEFSNIGEPTEDGETFEENCEIKSKYFLSKTNTLVLCDDSGFVVNKLNNYPGIKTAREAGVTLISDWGFRDDVPYGNWRKDQKAWLLNKDYSKKEAFYSFLRALYETQKY